MVLTINELIYVVGGICSLFTVYIRLNNRIITLYVNANNTEKEMERMKTEMKEINEKNILSIKEVTEALHENSSAVRELRAVINQLKP